MTAKFWDKRALKYNDDIEKHDGVYMQTIESTKSLLSTSDVVLDLGCASGEFSRDIAPRVQRTHGIDTSTKLSHSVPLCGSLRLSLVVMQLYKISRPTSEAMSLQTEPKE